MFVLDTREEGKKTVVNVPIIHKFPNVFLEDSPVVPLERKVHFWIDLISGAAPIAKAPYHLAPLEM